MSDFGAKLREFRTRANLSQGGLAKELGVTVAYVSDVERGARKPFIPAKVHQVAKLLKLSPAEHEDLLLHRALAHGSFEIPYLDSSSTRHNAVAAMLQRTWDTLTSQELEAIFSIARGTVEHPTKPSGAPGRWIRSYSHKTRGGTYEARTRGDGDYDVREPGQEAQRVPGGYFRAEFFPSPEAREQEKTESIAAEAERLGVEFVVVDDRPIDPAYREPLRVQARAFADLLVELKLPVQAVKDGMVELGQRGAKALLKLTVEEMRQVLRKAGGRDGFAAELLKLEKAAPLRAFVDAQRDMVSHLVHSMGEREGQT